MSKAQLKVEGGLSELVAALRSVQKETNTLLTQEIERQGGGSGDVEDDNEEDDDESEEEKEPETKVAKLQ